MSKVFEDEFMEFQSDLISLCMELVEDHADKVYVYCSIEEKSQSFNAFFEVDGEIKRLSQLGLNDALIFEFLNLGTCDLSKLRKICEKYNRQRPTEMKMVYDVKTGKFKAKYRYDEICSYKTDIDPSEVINQWYDELTQKI